MQADSQASSGGASGSGRRVSRILFWYVAREYLLPLVCCLFAFVALFMVQELFDVLPDVLQSQRVGFGQIAHYFLILQPTVLPVVMPMAALLAASFMVCGFQRHHELSAMRAGGMSLAVCARPVWLVGLVLSLAALWLGESLAPQCKLMADRMRHAWGETGEIREVYDTLCFNNGVARRDWFFAQFNAEGEQRDIMVKQFRPDHTTEWELTARSGSYEAGQWVFREGAFRRFDQQGRLLEGPVEPFERRGFPELSETPEQIANHMRDVEELSIAQMLATMRYNPALPERSLRLLRTTIWYRVVFSFSSLVGALLGVALTISYERGGNLRGFALAIGLMVAHYVFCHIALVLGQQAYVPPFVGGALPTLAFLGIGVWQMHRKR